MIYSFYSLISSSLSHRHLHFSPNKRHFSSFLVDLKLGATVAVSFELWGNERCLKSTSASSQLGSGPFSWSCPSQPVVWLPISLVEDELTRPVCLAGWERAPPCTALSRSLQMIQQAETAAELEEPWPSGPHWSCFYCSGGTLAQQNMNQSKQKRRNDEVTDALSCLGGFSFPGMTSDFLIRWELLEHSSPFHKNLSDINSPFQSTPLPEEPDQ